MKKLMVLFALLLFLAVNANAKAPPFTMSAENDTNLHQISGWETTNSDANLMNQQMNLQITKTDVSLFVTERPSAEAVDSVNFKNPQYTTGVGSEDSAITFNQINTFANEGINLPEGTVSSGLNKTKVSRKLLMRGAIMLSKWPNSTKKTHTEKF